MANRGVAQALYLYGISRSADAKASRVANPGIDGVHPVQSISCGNFLCWVSAIDHAGFSQEITRNMENLEWLAIHSVRHQQVVAEVGARSTIIPARFGTVFSGEPALVKDVLGRKSALEKVFARISLARKLVKLGGTGATKWPRSKNGRCCSDNTAGVEQSL